ncbi:MAG: glycosyltransferase family 4 protein, partial [Blautia sp.]|nr:glycosyltransferase family 4 protein [Blautia sp.]
CGKMGIPFSANVQGLGTAFQKPALAGFVTMLYRLAFRKVQTVFFENSANMEEFQKRHIMPVEKQVLLAGAGVDLEQYTLQPYPVHDKVHFLYLGRIMKEKGMDELFEAVRRLSGQKEGFVLDLVGFFEDEYREQVEQLEKDGIAVFYGFQQDPVPFYKEADCVILPSYHEGMSNVLLEGAAVGRPLITSDIPGCREAVEDGKNGFLVKAGDSESLLQAMQKFLCISQEKRRDMGMAGHEKMIREFGKKMVVETTIQNLRV